MAKSKKMAKPTYYQAAILKLIAASPLIKTHTEDGVRWSLANGRTIPEPCANALIRNGWVKPQRDGLGMFDESQTYTALVP